MNLRKHEMHVLFSCPTRWASCRTRGRIRHSERGVKSSTFRGGDSSPLPTPWVRWWDRQPSQSLWRACSCSYSSPNTQLLSSVELLTFVGAHFLLIMWVPFVHRINFNELWTIVIICYTTFPQWTFKKIGPHNFKWFHSILPFLFKNTMKQYSVLHRLQSIIKNS